MIEEQFGQRVLALVEGCIYGIPDATGQKADWHTRKRSCLNHLAEAHEDVLLISATDKPHNARAIVSDLKSVGKNIFEQFSTK